MSWLSVDVGVLWREIQREMWGRWYFEMYEGTAQM